MITGVQWVRAILTASRGFPAVPKHWGCAAAFGDTEQSLRLPSGVSWLCVCGWTGDGMMVLTLLRLAGGFWGSQAAEGTGNGDAGGGCFPWVGCPSGLALLDC